MPRPYLTPFGPFGAPRAPRLGADAPQVVSVGPPAPAPAPVANPFLAPAPAPAVDAVTMFSQVIDGLVDEQTKKMIEFNGRLYKALSNATGFTAHLSFKPIETMRAEVDDWHTQALGWIDMGNRVRAHAHARMPDGQPMLEAWKQLGNKIIGDSIELAKELKADDLIPDLTKFAEDFPAAISKAVNQVLTYAEHGVKAVADAGAQVVTDVANAAGKAASSVIDAAKKPLV